MKKGSPDNKLDSPIKAIVIGLSISIVLVNIVSFLIAFVFYIANSSIEGYKILHDNLFLAIDLSIAGFLFFLSGRVVRRYSRGNETKFGLLVVTITLLAYLLLSFSFNSFDKYPIWYSILLIALIPIGLGCGVLRVKLA